VRVITQQSKEQIGAPYCHTCEIALPAVVVEVLLSDDVVFCGRCALKRLNVFVNIHT
jgi:hypothetical protein